MRVEASFGLRTCSSRRLPPLLEQPVALDLLLQLVPSPLGIDRRPLRHLQAFSCLVQHLIQYARLRSQRAQPPFHLRRRRVLRLEDRAAWPDQRASTVPRLSLRLSSSSGKITESLFLISRSSCTMVSKFSAVILLPSRKALDLHPASSEAVGPPGSYMRPRTPCEVRRSVFGLVSVHTCKRFLRQRRKVLQEYCRLDIFGTAQHRLVQLAQDWSLEPLHRYFCCCLGDP